MISAFGGRSCLAGLDELPQTTTNDEQRRARAEMKAFDKLKSEARAAFRDACQQFSCVEVVDLVNRRGATPAVIAAARAQGLLPYQLGLDGVVVETVRQLDAMHTANFYAAKERGDKL